MFQYSISVFETAQEPISVFYPLCFFKASSLDNPCVRFGFYQRWLNLDRRASRALRTVDGFFLCSVVGITIVSAVLFWQTTVFNLLPSGVVEQEISANLPLPLEVMDILLTAGLILSAFAWGQGPSDLLYYLASTKQIKSRNIQRPSFS